MFSKILIANRGEIALRIIRAAKELGIKTVAVYSESDRTSLHALLADEKFCIGPARGPGQLPEHPQPPDRGRDHQGRRHPPRLRLPRRKPALRRDLRDGRDHLHRPAGFDHPADGRQEPGPPGDGQGQAADHPGQRQDHRGCRAKRRRSPRRSATRSSSRPRPAAAARACASAATPSISRSSFPIAQNEAKSAFGDPSLYIEKYLADAHHIEIQVVGDKKGNVIVFGERECSVQRKYQKVIEETPSPFVDERLRKRMMSAVEDAAKYIGYESLGTFEFLVDENKNFYFMEANTRVQVEHPITEMVYGINLVKAQIRAAAGEKVTFPFELEMRGHAIECRINAEDPATFAPSPGQDRFPRPARRRGHPGRLGAPTAAGRSRPTTIRSSPRSSPTPQPGTWRSRKCRPPWR